MSEDFFVAYSSLLMRMRLEHKLFRRLAIIISSLSKSVKSPWNLLAMQFRAASSRELLGVVGLRKAVVSISRVRVW